MRILFCTDGSKISFNALKNFSRWVKNVIVDTICIIDWSFLPEDVNVETEGFAASCANIADNILNYADDVLLMSGFIAGEKIKHCGNAVENIIERINCQKYDFVVMGSHGKKGLQKWLGSVSSNVTDNNPASSYISKHPNKGEKLLITLDELKETAEVIEKYLPLLDLKDKEIYLCTVNEDPDFLFLEGNIDTNMLIQIQKNQEEYAQKILNRLKSFLQNSGLDVMETEILTGIPATEILNYAKSHEIDLIIAGARNKTKTVSFFTGSVSRKVLENTSSDVMILKNNI